MKNKYLKSLLIIVLLFFYFPAFCLVWGPNGHRVVAEIAENYLKPNTRLEIKKILGSESMAMSSTWTDFVRSDPNYAYLNNWHYVNIDRGLSETELTSFLKRDTTTSAYTQINLILNELKRKELMPTKKRMYLRLLIHLVADIHQPLHTGNKGDHGGGEIQVTWMDKPNNLHWVWDEEVINFQQLSYTEYAKSINEASSSQREEWAKSDLNHWIFESYQLSDIVYASAKSGDKLSFKYNYDYIATINQQLLKGGIRLAALLNQLFA